jgi:hypothetical protein
VIEVLAPLVAIAGRFTHRYEPYQAISLEVGPGGAGVMVASSDRGAASFVAHDPRGTYDEPTPRVKLLPTPELLRPCNGIKTAERRVMIDGDRAVISSYGKTKTSVAETPVAYSALRCISARDIAHCAARRKAIGASKIAHMLGRFDVALLRNAIRILEDHGEPVILSLGHGLLPDGGDAPLRIFSESLNAVVLIQPMKKKDQPYPPPPPWLENASRLPVMADSPFHPTHTP